MTRHVRNLLFCTGPMVFVAGTRLVRSRPSGAKHGMPRVSVGLVGSACCTTRGLCMGGRIRLPRMTSSGRRPRVVASRLLRPVPVLRRVAAVGSNGAGTNPGRTLSIGILACDKTSVWYWGFFVVSDQLGYFHRYGVHFVRQPAHDSPLSCC